MRDKIFYITLSAIFIVVWIWAAYEPKHFDDWLLENILVFIFVPIIYLTGRYFRLSKLSYTLITVFMILHVIGSHYTYAETPFGETLKEWLGSDRNMYDRLVHLTFGLLLVYPIREISVRIAKTRGFWGYFVPFMIISAMAGFYEVIEWIAAINVDPVAGSAFLGTQGDEWDAQKDMALAIVGAFITLFIVFIINLTLNPNFYKEFKDSFKLPKDDHPLGEEELERLLRD
jgi:putative membrane protein